MMSPKLENDSFDETRQTSVPGGVALTSKTSSWPAISELGSELTVDSSLRRPAAPLCISDRFRVEQLLGSGAFGAVYRCYDEQLQHQVAIKLAHDRPASGSDGCDELLHEARASARVSHPHIVGVKDVGKTQDGRPYVVFDLVQGQSLKEVLASGQYTLAEVVTWVADLADALHVAHKNRLVHRDIKPANILIDDRRQALLSDFGLARVNDRFFAYDRGCVGTVAYMSPEQAAGLSHLATPQSDLYSLGVVLYELICGQRPFIGDDKKELCEQICHKAVVPPRALRDDVPTALERVCLKALAKRPEDRYATGKDFAAELRSVLPRPSHRRLAALMIIVVGLCVLALAVASHRLKWTDAPPHTSLVPPPPELKINVVPGGATPSKPRVLSVGDAPWRAGDQAVVAASAAPATYSYLYHFESTPAGWSFTGRLFPENLEHPMTTTVITTEPIPVTGAKGWDLVLLVSSAQPLSDDQDIEIRQAIENSLSPLAHVKRVSELSAVRQLLDQDDDSARRTARGMAPNEPAMQFFVGGLPQPAADLIHDFRSNYHGWIIPRE